jgi:hypothetical protein
MPDEKASTNDRLPDHAFVIEVRVPDLAHLFNAMDPSPFRDRDLDPKAEEFIVDWARGAPRNAPLALVVHLEKPAVAPDEPAILRDSIHEYFLHRAQSTRQRLALLFRIGRTSLAIGVVFLAATVALGSALEHALGPGRLGEIARESLLIGGWVAMWRPLEIFLYDWWPILAEARLLERLAAMPVRVTDAPHPDEHEKEHARKAEASRA